MIDIILKKVQLTEINMTCDEMFGIVMDSFIEPDTFIKLKFANGDYGAVRKKDIVAFIDSEEEVKQ
jgi:hypothetical protein